MEVYIGLDVSLASTAICVRGEKGKIVTEARVARAPDALVSFLRELPPRDHGDRPRGRSLVSPVLQGDDRRRFGGRADGDQAGNGGTEGDADQDRTPRPRARAEPVPIPQGTPRLSARAPGMPVSSPSSIFPAGLRGNPILAPCIVAVPPRWAISRSTGWPTVLKRTSRTGEAVAPISTMPAVSNETPPGRYGRRVGTCSAG